MRPCCVHAADCSRRDRRIDEIDALAAHRAAGRGALRERTIEMSEMTLYGMRQVQGGREHYTANMTLAQVADSLPLREKDEWKRVGEHNRPIDLKHVRDIAAYLETAESPVLPGMLIGCRPDAIQWRPARAGAAIGSVKIDTADIEALIDGQHRRAAVDQVREDLAARMLGDDAADARQAEDLLARIEAIEVAVTLIEGTPDEYRQAYVDIDQQKRAGPETAVRFDTRNPFAIAAREVADSHPFLSDRDTGTEWEKRGANSHFTSLANLATQILPSLYGIGGRGHISDRSKLPGADDAGKRLTAFLDDLIAATPLKAVADGDMTVTDARQTAHTLASYVMLLPIYANVWRGLKFATPVREAEEVREMLSRLPQTVDEALALGILNPFAAAGMEIGRAPNPDTAESRDIVKACLEYIANPPSRNERKRARQEDEEEALETFEDAIEDAEDVNDAAIEAARNVIRKAEAKRTTATAH